MKILVLLAAALLALSADGDARAQAPAGAVHLSEPESPGTTLLRTLNDEEYDFRSAAEAIPADKWDFRPADGVFKSEKPDWGPSRPRTFAEIVKHVACANFAFAASLDRKPAPEHCDTGGPNPAQTPAELLTYLRDSFIALKKSAGAIGAKSQAESLEGMYGIRETRLGFAVQSIWHIADHYGQMTVYLRLNGVVPPSSRHDRPKLRDSY